MTRPTRGGYWEVFQLSDSGRRILLCSARMKLNERQARNVVDNNKRKGMICETCKEGENQ